MHCVPDSLTEVLAAMLSRTGHIIVFAESCTAGLVAASLGRVAGVSEVLAGSAVVYQLATKSAWLQVPASLLENPGPVSQVVSEHMARGALQITPHATMAASVTGHLGPGAPAELDGVVWATVAVRRDDRIDIQSRSFTLHPPKRLISAEADGHLRVRHWRQVQAAQVVLEFCLQTLGGETLESAGGVS
ncbi:MAG: CinA family protein [Planctomycetaceae bacterium]